MSYDGLICHVEIPAPDIEKAANFYEQAFGWSVRRHVPGPGYWLFACREGASLGGGLDAGKKPSPGKDGVMFYVGCTSIDAALPKVLAAGGSLVRARESIEGHGFDALVRDPNGNLLGLYEAPAS